MKVLLTVIALFFLFSASAQNEQKHWIVFAEEAMESGDFYGASRYYKKALSADPGEIDLQYLYAESLRLSYNFADAQEWYMRVYRKERGRYYPKGPYWIAQMMEANGEYEDAIKYWDRVAKEEPETSRVRSRAEQRIKSCIWAMSKKDSSDLSIEVYNLGEQVNSPESEFGGQLTSDQQLIFASLRGDYNEQQELKDTADYRIRLYRSDMNEGTAPELLDSILHLGEEVLANPSMSRFETVLYFSKQDKSGNTSIYRSMMTDGVYGRAEKLEQQINAPNSNNTQPQLIETDSQKLLFFASDRPTGEGGMDIYLSVWEANGWTTARNLGKAINSPDNEITPHFDMANNTLYFSSDWHEGFGMMDIFSAQGSVKDGFRNPQNMGRPFNSSVNDMYYSKRIDSSGFLTSNRPGSFSLKGETCCNDIYGFRSIIDDVLTQKALTDSIDLAQEDYELSQDSNASKDLPASIGSIDELGDYLPITLYFHNDRPNPKSIETTTALSYDETIDEYLGMKDAYVSFEKDDAQNVEMTDAKTSIGNFFKEVSREYERLDQVCTLLYSELEKGKSIELAIKGYASPLAKSDYNKFLTQRRIESLVNYFQRWNNRLLLPYIAATESDKTRLTFLRIPFGENQADSSVSDRYEDRQQSVYSVGAARERRIEILRIEEK